MTPDKKERHDTLLNMEKQLSNGKRGDPVLMCEHQVEMSKSMRVMLSTDMVTPADLATHCAAQHTVVAKPHPINWPTASIIMGIGTAIYKIIEGAH
jgi:hypothetical protein